MKLLRSFVVGVGAMFLLTGSIGTAMADDFSPPPWRDLGHPYSTLQAWDFLTPLTPLEPDDPNVPLVVGDGLGGGPPVATVVANLQWDAGSPDFPGVWVPTDPSGGLMELFIPNWIDNEPLKLIWVQTRFIGNPSTPPSVFDVFAIDGNTGIYGAPTGPPVVTTLDSLNGIYGVTEEWQVIPNPDYETINIFVPPDVAIDQIVVDTISFPEPGSLALVALGLAVVMRRR